MSDKVSVHPLMVIALPDNPLFPILVSKEGYKKRESNIKEAKDLVFAAVLQGHIIEAKAVPALGTYISIFKYDDVKAAADHAIANGWQPTKDTE